MPLRAVESTRLYRQIADQIAALIGSGEFRVGDRLPAERELATLLHVSRTSVREAIICLEIAGRVDVRVGSGIYVREPPPDAASGVADDAPGPFELLDARSLIEGEIAARAAQSIGRDDLARLNAALARMREGAEDAALRDAADRDFHIVIAQATGNAALAGVVARLWSSRSHPMWRRIQSHLHTPALHAMTLEDHAAIVAALAAHDAALARAAMHRHLARVAREFQRRWESPGPPEPSPTDDASAASTRRRTA